MLDPVVLSCASRQTPPHELSGNESGYFVVVTILVGGDEQGYTKFTKTQILSMLHFHTLNYPLPHTAHHPTLLTPDNNCDPDYK